MLSPTQIEKTIKSAPLVFVGIVKQIKASNLEAIKASNDFSLVQILNVIDAPQAFQGITGTIVTIKSAANTKLKTGDTRLFYTKKFMYGENLALEAVEVEKVEKDHRQIVHDLRNVKSNMERKKQLTRIQNAILIVEGKVISMKESDLNKNYPLSFKSPYWIVVSIKLSKTLRGRYNNKTIDSLINKGGETEEETPLEINIGQSGVWILKKEKISNNKKSLGEFYIIEEPEDFLNSYEYQMLINPTLK